MITACCAIAFYVGWHLAVWRQRKEHRPRLLVLLGERHIVGVLPPAGSTPQWRCVETGKSGPALCACVGCRDFRRFAWPNFAGKTWRDVELAWLRGEIATPLIRRALTMNSRSI